MEVRKTFGRRLRQLRLARGLTQEHLATVGGLTAKYISELESGKGNPTLEVMHRLLVDGLGTTVSVFFADDKVPKVADGDLRVIEALLKSQPARTRAQVVRVVKALVQSP